MMNYLEQKCMQILVVLTLVLLGWPGSNHAGDWEIFRKGTNANAFLLIGTDPRSMALGGEGTGLLRSTSIFWNPANALNTNGLQLQHEIGNYLLDMDHQITTIHVGLGSGQKISLIINNLDMGQEEITTVLEPQGTEQYYSSQSYALGLNYARLLTDRVSVGLQAKLVREQIWLEQAQNVAWDVGLRYVERESKFVLGMSIQNIGSLNQLETGPLTTFTRREDDSNPGSVNNDAAYDLKIFPMPLLFRMGISKEIHLMSKDYFTPSILFNAGFSDGITTPFNASFGTEISPVKALKVRAGYQLNRDLGEFSAGIGLSIPLAQGMRLIMDYAWIDMDYFGAVERYQLSMEF